ncbi:MULTISPECIES: zinc-dependent metalloprotease [Colwellia]|uniref:Periplasmic metalloprotease n=2 Tax=Gammaproteobacteria TaxID=1236 RepID=A0ABQ0MQG3_9GAMM|nr:MULTISPECIES: zinc-dependent metalloprotease [Colwellia]GAW94609.1 periplasmic metalloprotease [Colwellia marinimaniae]
MKLTRLAIALTLALGSSQIALADDAEKDKAKKEEQTIAQMIENKTATLGLFDFYQDKETGETLMLLDESQLDTPFLHFAQTVDGLADAGHFRGGYRGEKIIEFRRYFDRIDIVTKTYRYQFDENNPISRAKDANISEAVLASIKIEKVENGKIVLKVDKLFLSEALHKVSPWARVDDKDAKKRFKLGKLNSKKSRILSKRAYDNNVDIVVDYVFNNPNPSVYGSKAVSDPRSVSIKLQHSFIELPKNEFTPRYQDARIGYFGQQYDQMTSSSWAPYKDVINRWNLVKKDPSAALSEPVEPIVWWIENTTPIEWRNTISEAVLAWNSSFEKAGFKNALQVKIQPDDATWQAGDLNYNVLRWTSSPQPRFGGYGPSLANPLTGQLLGADIMLEFVFMKNRWIYNSLYSQGAVSVGFSDIEQLHQGPGSIGALNCSAGYELQQGLLLSQAMSKGSDIENKAVLKEGLRHLVLHEVGHTLGLNHNMKASILWDEKEIHDKSLTQGALTGSVMDYAPINVAPRGTTQGDYFQTEPGLYDDWAIEYGYSIALEDSTEEAERLATILARSNEKGLAFGNDADDMRAPGRHIDPRIMTSDLSSNPVAYASDRMALIQSLLSELKDKTLIDGQSHQQLLISVNSLFGQYRRQAEVISRQIGGVYIERNVVDHSKTQSLPYTPVPKEKQQAAMQALTSYVFAGDTLASMQPLYNYMQHQRRGFNHFDKNEDPKAHDMILNMQKSVLNQLLHKKVLKRISDTSLYGNDYSLTAVLSDLTAAIFVASKKASSISRNIQVEYVERLIAIAGVAKSSAYDNLAKAAALGQLSEILDNSSSMSFGKSVEAKAQDAYISLMINKALKV